MSMKKIVLFDPSGICCKVPERQKANLLAKGWSEHAPHKGVISSAVAAVKHKMEHAKGE